MDAVDADIQQHLLQLGAVAQHVFPVQLQLLPQPHLFGAVGLHQLAGVLDEAFHGHRVIDRFHVLPAHGRNLLHHVPGLFGSFADLPGVVINFTLGVGVGHNEVGIARDGGEEVVELVGDASRQGAHELEPLVVRQRLPALLQLFQRLVDLLQVVDFGHAALVLPLQTEYHPGKQHQNHRNGAEHERHLQKAVPHRLVEIVVIHHGADDPEAAPHIQMPERADLMHPGQFGVGPPVGVIIPDAGVLCPLGLEQLAQAGQVQIFIGIELLAAIHHLDAPLGRFRVHDYHVIGVFDHHIAVGAHPDIRDQLLVEGGRIHHQADALLPRRFFQHQIMGIAPVVLPVRNAL